ncbi:serine/threonine protein kinase, partial [filamentous cyanobacterium CCP1]
MNSSQPSDAWFGRLIGDSQRYRIDKHLGGGGMGDVFLATDMSLGRSVALKLLKERLAIGELRKRFEREVAVCVALRSEHIVQISDYGVTSEGYPFYVMEYLLGQTLRQLLKCEKRLSAERTVQLIAQVCDGLYLAHQGVYLPHASSSEPQRVKVIHRDLKPDNIFLVPTALGELVKVLDFGIAKLRSDRVEHTIAATTMFLGTYRYAAPEQLEIEHDLDERADIYSLGIILYEMLSGNDPFGLGMATSPVSGVTWAVAHCSKPPIPLRQQPGCENLSPALEATVMRCLMKSPNDRFSSVRELQADLQAAIDHPHHISSGQILFPTSPSFTDDESVGETALGTTAMTSVTENVRLTTHATEYKEPVQAARLQFLRRPVSLVVGTGLLSVLFLGFSVYHASQSSTAPGWQAEFSEEPELVPLIQSDQTVDAADEPVSANSVAIEASFLTNSLVGHLDTVWAVTLSPDGETVASGSYDATIKLWDAETGELRRTLLGHSDAVRSLVMSPDGQTLASGSSDATIKLWDMETGELRRTLSGHSGPIWSVAISSDGRVLASGSYDGTVRVWDLESGTLIYTLPEHYDSVWSVAISPDGQTVVSGSYDGTAKIWDLRTGELI